MNIERAIVQIMNLDGWNLKSLSNNKAKGLTLLAQALNIDMSEVAAFGDAENDIPMLQAAGQGIALQNASDEVKQHAHRVSPWTNDEDAIAHEWERIKSR